MPLSPTKRVHGFEESQAYKDAGRRLDQLAQSGLSWSGHERNCAYLNTGSGRFANVSAVSGFDFDDDGRSLALVDWDHDGDLDIWAANRTGPRLRFLRNDTASNHRFLALRLTGQSSNRDAIGARVEVTLGPQEKTLIKTLRAGEGFLGQSSKWLHFGLGQATSIIKVVIRWPDGELQALNDLAMNRHYLIEQGQTSAKTWNQPTGQHSLAASTLSARNSNVPVRIVLRSKVPLPLLSYETLEGRTGSVRNSDDRPTLLVLWSSSCQPCVQELSDLTSYEAELRKLGVRTIALSVDELNDGAAGEDDRRLIESIGYPFEAGRAKAELVEKLQLVHDHLFKPHRPLAVPVSFLIDAQGRLAVMNKGPLAIDQLAQDIQNLGLTGADLLDAALPFTGRWFAAPRGARLLPLAASLIEQEMLEDAIQYVEQNEAQLIREPGYHDLLYRLGRELLKQGKRESAVAWFRQGMKSNPNDATGYYNLGIALAAQGQDDAAIENYRRAIQLDPTHVKAINNLGNLYLARQQFEEAEGVYLRALELNADLADVHYNLANAYLAQKKPNEAERHFNEAVRINPQHARAHNNLGIILAQRDLSSATDHYRMAVNSDPRYAQAQNNLATALAMQGEVESAIGHYLQAIRAEPRLADAHSNLGRLLASRHRYPEAIKHLGIAADLDPESHQAITFLAWILATHPDQGIRDPAKAVQLATRAVELTRRRSPGALDTLAAAYASMGEFDQAVEIANDAYEMFVKLGGLKQANDVQRRRELYRSEEPFQISLPNDEVKNN